MPNPLTRGKRKSWKFEALKLEEKVEQYEKKLDELRKELEETRAKFYSTEKPKILQSTDDKKPLEKKETAVDEGMQSNNKINLSKQEEGAKSPSDNQENKKEGETMEKQESSSDEVLEVDSDNEEYEYQCPNCEALFNELKEGKCPECDAELTDD